MIKTSNNCPEIKTKNDTIVWDLDIARRNKKLVKTLFDVKANVEFMQQILKNEFENVDSLIDNSLSEKLDKAISEISNI